MAEILFSEDSAKKLEGKIVILTGVQSYVSMYH